ncbi:hypothetical protein JTE90_023253 [Oedothorax gibbosus]|uniref:Uncharacterized protein n=1 Tax=Oedothorax gibbosus TaxID=931172 RepID=A0AAV6U3P7_9ARAC|nr:hypothetical protein JTE90_023253 [Oedothorax gibbosus]
MDLRVCGHPWTPVSSEWFNGCKYQQDFLPITVTYSLERVPSHTVDCVCVSILSFVYVRYFDTSPSHAKFELAKKK